MREFTFGLAALRGAAKSARKDVADVSLLRKQISVAEGASFFIGKTLWVWASGDITPDDGVKSVRPENVADTAPGRFRRAGFGHRIHRR